MQPHWFEQLIRNMHRSRLASALVDGKTLVVTHMNSAMEAFAKSCQLLDARNLFTESDAVQQALAACREQRQLVTADLDGVEASMEVTPLWHGGALLALHCVILPAASDAILQRFRDNLNLDCETILNSFPHNIFLCTPKGEIFWTNATSNLYATGHKTVTDFDNTGWINKIHPEDFNYACRQFSTGMARGQMESFRYRLRHHSGEFRWVQCLATPVLTAEGKIKYWVACNVNVDAFKREEDAAHAKSRELTLQVQALTARLEKSQELISQAQKLELVSQLAGGVAHDLNNLLFVMGLNTDIVRRQIHDQGLRDNLDSVHDSIRKAARLSSQLAGFSGRKPESARAVNPLTFMHDTQDLLRKAVGAEVQFTVNVHEDTPNVLVDKTYLENALINLAINARDAVDGRGSVSVEVRRESVDLHGQPQVCAAFSVSDNGAGMPAEVKQRMFEPFFTTKSPGKGTGLGLPMVKNFVDNSNGVVKVRTREGHGSTITMYFPQTDRRVSDTEEVEPIVAGGKEAILVVEDDEAVRHAVSSALCALGYEIVSAVNPEHAILFLKGGLQVDLIVSDIRMPGKLSVLDMVRHVEAHLPSLPIVFATGYSADIAIQEGLLGGRYPVLFKPFSMNELAGQVRRTLEEHISPSADLSRRTA